MGIWKCWKLWKHIGLECVMVMGKWYLLDILVCYSFGKNSELLEVVIGNIAPTTFENK